MPQSLDQVYLHTIFSTKDRFPFFQTPELQRNLHAYLASVSNELKCTAIKVGGVADHVHLLTRLPRIIKIADFVKETKRVRSQWLHERGDEWSAFHCGRRVMAYFQFQRRMSRKWRNISPGRRSITGM